MSKVKSKCPLRCCGASYGYEQSGYLGVCHFCEVGFWLYKGQLWGFGSDKKGPVINGVIEPTKAQYYE